MSVPGHRAGAVCPPRSGRTRPVCTSYFNYSNYLLVTPVSVKLCSRRILLRQCTNVIIVVPWHAKMSARPVYLARLSIELLLRVKEDQARGGLKPMSAGSGPHSGQPEWLARAEQTRRQSLASLVAHTPPVCLHWPRRSVVASHRTGTVTFLPVGWLAINWLNRCYPFCNWRWESTFNGFICILEQNRTVESSSSSAVKANIAVPVTMEAAWWRPSSCPLAMTNLRTIAASETPSRAATSESLLPLCSTKSPQVMSPVVVDAVEPSSPVVTSKPVPSPVQASLIGQPCGHHGSYTFYKALKYRLSPADPQRVLMLGEFFYVRTSPDAQPAIGEVQLLWKDDQSNQTLSSTRLYYLPQNTPSGRQSYHGQVGDTARGWSSDCCWPWPLASVSTLLSPIV